MQLVQPNDPILTTPCQPFDFKNPAFDPVEFSREFIKFMYDNNGIGLSANQVGVPYRIFAMRGSPENFVCFNPKIVQPSTAEIFLEEICLTYPGLSVKIKRPQHIRVRFTMANGETVTKQFTGMTARIFQQQLDHLNGIIFYSRANLYHREQALKKWKNGENFEIRIKT